MKVARRDFDKQWTIPAYAGMITSIVFGLPIGIWMFCCFIVWCLRTGSGDVDGPRMFWPPWWAIVAAAAVFSFAVYAHKRYFPEID